MPATRSRRVTEQQRLHRVDGILIVCLLLFPLGTSKRRTEETRTKVFLSLISAVSLGKLFELCESMSSWVKMCLIILPWQDCCNPYIQ